MPAPLRQTHLPLVEEEQSVHPFSGSPHRLNQGSIGAGLPLNPFRTDGQPALWRSQGVLQEPLHRCADRTVRDAQTAGVHSIHSSELNAAEGGRKKPQQDQPQAASNSV